MIVDRCSSRDLPVKRSEVFIGVSNYYRPGFGLIVQGSLSMMQNMPWLHTVRHARMGSSKRSHFQRKGGNPVSYPRIFLRVSPSPAQNHAPRKPNRWDIFTVQHAHKIRLALQHKRTCEERDSRGT